MQAKIEMNHIPLSVTEPLVNRLNATHGRTTVCGRPIALCSIVRFSRKRKRADDERHKSNEGYGRANDQANRDGHARSWNWNHRVDVHGRIVLPAKSRGYEDWPSDIEVTGKCSRGV